MMKRSIGGLRRAGVEWSSGYWLKGEMEGTSAMFLYPPFTGRGRHDGAAGMDRTPRSVRGCQAPHSLPFAPQFSSRAPSRGTNI